jgi:hypothetical protein
LQVRNLLVDRFRSECQDVRVRVPIAEIEDDPPRSHQALRSRLHVVGFGRNEAKRQSVEVA